MISHRQRVGVGRLRRTRGMLGASAATGLVTLALAIGSAAQPLGLQASYLAAHKAPKAPKDVRPAVTFTGFHVFEDGSSRIWVRLTHAVLVEEKPGKGTVTYVLRGAKVPGRNNKNPLLTSHFSSAVMSARLVPTKHDTELVVMLKEAVSPKYRVIERPDKTASVQIDIPAAPAASGANNTPSSK
ncbi:MAG TPA: hypothetical protein VL137_04790 [Polyangiaceae bacterium]|nr:hypothetical protein [Polyangiaceae bacterium]